MYLGEAGGPPGPGTYTQAEIDDWIARTAAQPADSFVMPGARTVGEFWEKQGFTRASLEQLAQQGLDQEAMRAWAESVNPNFGKPTATTPSQRATASGIPATRDQVVNAFRNTPGANPQPDDAAISYYMGKGVAQLVIDVAAIRKSNPALAAQIDAQRRAMGLPTAGGTATPITPVTTPTIGTGGITTLLLAAAAAYLIGS